MTLLNQALHESLALLNSQKVEENKAQSRTSLRHRRRVAQEMSSFTVTVLPVECWHALEIVAAHCGPTITSEPPYMIEFFLQDSHLDHAVQSWCRCDLVPEAGSTTVHVTVGSSRDGEVPEIEDVRDRLVQLLKELDWPTD